MTTFCTNCAAELPADTILCGNCGAAVAVDAPQPIETTESLAPITPQTEAVAQPEPFAQTIGAQKNALEGISGWLILVAIRLALWPFLMLRKVLAGNIWFLINPDYHSYLSAHPSIQALLFGEVFTDIIIFAGAVALNYLFYTKRKAFPTYMIILTVFSLCYLIFDTIARYQLIQGSDLSKSYLALFQTIVYSAIWIPYLMVSERVKATFVR